MKRSWPFISTVILNYNYGRYLRQCIRSVFEQVYSKFELIVVDDGSTDNSGEILSEFDGKCKVIFQENSGVIAASNVGFAAARGDIIHFLDADDYLMPGAYERVGIAFKKGVSKVHGRMLKVTEDGNSIGYIPSKRWRLGTGDCVKSVLRWGMYPTVPMSGNFYSKKVLGPIFPLEKTTLEGEAGYSAQVPTDALLTNWVPLLGEIVSVEGGIACYRQHGANHGSGKSFLSNSSRRKRRAFLLRRDFGKYNRIHEEYWKNWTGWWLLNDMERCRSVFVSYILGEDDLEYIRANRLGFIAHSVRNILQLGSPFGFWGQLYLCAWVAFGATFVPRVFCVQYVRMTESVESFAKKVSGRTRGL